MQEKAAFSLAHLMLPARPTTGGPPPALLVLHGRGADEHDLFGLAGRLDPRLAMISARAPFPLGPGYHWYELIEIGAAEPRSFAAAYARLAAFVDEIGPAYGLDPARLFVLGFSQGAVMAASLALTMPGRLAGAVLLSGYVPLGLDLPIDTAGLRDLPVFVGHGLDDTLIPIRYGRLTRDELTRLSLAVTYHEYPIAHSISDEELTDIAACLDESLRDSRA
jgi:phospholipase/carboxylesterase